MVILPITIDLEINTFVEYIETNINNNQIIKRSPLSKESNLVYGSEYLFNLLVVKNNV